MPGQHRQSPSKPSRITALTAFIASVAAVASVVVAVIALSHTQPTAIDHRMECAGDHGMRSTRERESWANLIIFKQCDWPPNAQRYTDGYSEVRASSVRIAERGNADLYNYAWTLRADCDLLALSVVLTHMAGRSFRNFRLREGRLVMVTTRTRHRRPAITVRTLDRIPPDVHIPPPEPGTFGLLTTGHVELHDARCTGV